MVRRPTPAVRQQVDQGGEPGEQSLSNEGIWRRTGRDFILGAGQEFFDEPEESTRLRFWSSKGINPWERRRLELHNGTQQILSTAATNIELLPVGARFYAVDGQTLKYTLDPTVASPTWVSITNNPAADIADITSDGSNVYIAYAANGIFKVTGAAGTMASLGASPNATKLQYANGRLIGSAGAEVFEISSAGAKTTIWTHHNTSAVWNVICPAPNGIYLGLLAGERSEVYLTTVPDATGALSSPFIVDPDIPVGEKLYAATYYGSVIVYLTSRGVRLAQISGSGHLAHGPVIQIANTQGGAIEGQAEFVWFSWNNYDGTSTGLGRLKLDRFTADLVPAYASDLMATTQGLVQSVASFGGRRYFAVSGVGVYGETTTKVTSGTYSSGWNTYGVPERKSVAAAEIKHDPLPAGASVVLAVEEEDGTSTTALTSNASSAVEKAAEVSGVETESVRVNLTLARATDTTTGPKVRRWSIRSLPMPYRSEEIFLKVFIRSKVEDDVSGPFELDTLDEWTYLKGLEAARTRVPFVLADESLTVVVDEVGVNEGDTHGWNDDATWVEADVVVKMIAIRAA